MDRTLEAHAALNVLEERIRVLWSYRRWFRRYRWADEPFKHAELNAELRILVRLLREARKVARHAQERVDPMSIAKDDSALALGDHFAGMGHLPSSMVSP